MNRMVTALLMTASAVAVLGACGTTTAGTPVTVVREIVPPSTTTAVVAPPATSVVVVEPPVTVTRAPSRTSCQRLLAEGFSYTYAFEAWVNAGRPLSWDADRDGYPCEQSYGNRN
ncbi:hypothetical protein NQK81_06855 [Amycolatopsis roodepoortensis]|uniref:hypothetical protein n=1 Tax=Amycolatopsis roodepoortensis TaxID=700274 RepID=UPI00214AD3F4|nr:hypothetical protein [Amycolatopsis roodepoortensis]UUV33168.1 hypothetical protein NQK81_06855 [Amycolatopsis roodepoortensis]